MNDRLEERLRAEALRPEDGAFTQRVLAALPRHVPVALETGLVGSLRRSFALATKLGIVLALIVAAQRLYVSGANPLDSLAVILLGFVPALAAARRFVGPLLPRSVARFVRRP